MLLPVLLPVTVLIVLGATWAMTQPMTRIAVSTGHPPLGLLVWQLVVSVLLLGGWNLWRRKPLPLTPRALVLFVVLALLGTVLPNTANYKAAAHLPSGVMSIIISTVAMFTFPLAIAAGIDRFSWARMGGLVLGLVGIVLIATPEASLPDPAGAPFVWLALFASACYAGEGVYLGRRGAEGLGPVTVLLGASLVALVLALPFAYASGQLVNPLRVWAAPEYAITLSSVLNVVAYVGYIWLVGHSGAVFAAQITYLATGFGVFWAMLLLGESYSGPVWIALAAMMGGLALVQPRPRPEPQIPPDAAPPRNDVVPGGTRPQDARSTATSDRDPT